MSRDGIRYVVSGALAMLFVIGLTSFIVLPMYADYTERARVSDLLAEMGELKGEIAAAAIRSGSTAGVGQLISSQLKSNLKRFGAVVRIFQDGTIVAITTDQGSLVMLEPTLSEGEVTWSCLGGPKKDMPTQCRFSP